MNNRIRTRAKRQDAKLKKRKKNASATRQTKIPPFSEVSPLNPKPYPELVFGLIGPAGADRQAGIEVLTKELELLHYKVHRISLSKLIEKFLGNDYKGIPEDERINNLMTDGTKIREVSGRGDAVALLAIMEIKRIRDGSPNSHEPKKTAYILDSLKHPGEIVTLRNVYGLGFQALSIHTPRHVRVNALADRISQSRQMRKTSARGAAEDLIERDEEEEGTKLGQDVQEAFPLADFFVDARTKKKVDEIKRFVELLFNHPFHTPTIDEYGMYHAKSAALRSSDLGRQVGAAITSVDGNVIAVGCNDVPKSGGGLYWQGVDEDHRDFQRGFDSTAKQREHMLTEVLGRLKSASWLSEKNENRDLKDLVDSLLYGDDRKLLSKTQIMNLLEFGRSVHAEMAALMDAARRGVSVQGGTMYTTTFPCHMCTRHIIAAGIQRVIYIEPYPKSKAKDLYGDSIVVDQTKPVEGKVNFEPFVGVAPRQYQRLFEFLGDRKDKYGKAKVWKSDVQPQPRFERFLNTYLQIETTIVAGIIPDMLEKFGKPIR